MSLEQERKVCQKHQMEITTIDLKQSTSKEEKYLCIKCLIEKIDIQNMVLVDETKIMIKEMKSEQQTLKIKENQRRIETFKQIQCLIKEYKVQVENVIEKIIINIHQKIQLIEKDLEELDQKSKIYKFEDEVEILSSNYKGSFNYEIPIEFDKLEDDNQFYDSLQSMFQSFTNNHSYTQVIDILQSNQKIEKSKEIKVSSIQKEKQLDKSKTPSLNIKCNKHGKEIIMLNLEPNETQTSRLACVDCIHYNNPIKYTSLQDAGIKWDEFKGKTEDKIKLFQNQRSLQQEMIIQNLKEMREQYTLILNELIDKLNNEQQLTQLLQFNQSNQMDIYEFNQEQIDELTLILSKQDKFKALQDQQINIEKEDQIKYNLIINNLMSLFEFELLKREDILKIFKNDQSILNTIQIEDSKINNIQIQNMNQILRKIQKFDAYHGIFNQALNLYKSIIQNISDLSIQQQTINNEQQLNEEKIIESNIVINEQYEGTIQKFIKDTIEIKRLLMVDQLQQELKTKQNEIDSNSLKIIQFQDNQSKLESLLNSLQFKYDDSIKQNDILNKQNQSTLNNLTKTQEDCNNQISQITNLNQLLKNKENDIKKLNKQLQDTLDQLKSLQKDSQDITYLQRQIQIQLDQYPQSLTFSQSFKHNSCQISQNGKVVVETANNGNWFCCICDQMIPKHGLVKFAFKILDNIQVMLGIGFRDIIQKNNYQTAYRIGKGTYFIYYDGRCFNHDQQDKDDKQLSFKFTTNDMIIMEVDITNKYIKWIKQSTNESFTLNIDTSQDLYPCVNLGYKSKVEILTLFNK
ncbi:unnamed protein product [Paramecium octaurelia]|uniref:Uncharacterized protein n=1 Tax=Paramecium octaurelia TaxID=43137 RepID=A0A8S1W5K7_PAROT|nr:unnamed protein product [Paramecium octaurelia]